MARVKRNKLEIYNDILTAIKNESQRGDVKPTRVQHICNMSYDKFSKYLDELQNRKLIDASSIKISNKGQRFLEDYSKINGFISEMKIEYLDVEISK